MDLMQLLFKNPLRDQYTNSFDEDEILGDFSVNFRSTPTNEALEELSIEIMGKCINFCKSQFNYKELNKNAFMSTGFIKKKHLFFFSKKIDVSITFVDVKDKGFIVEDYCIKISADKSILTGGYKFNSYVTTKEKLSDFIKNVLFQ